MGIKPGTFIPLSIQSNEPRGRKANLPPSLAFLPANPFLPILSLISLSLSLISLSLLLPDLFLSLSHLPSCFPAHSQPYSLIAPCTMKHTSYQKYQPWFGEGRKEREQKV